VVQQEDLQRIVGNHFIGLVLILTYVPVAFHRYLSTTDISEPAYDTVVANYSQADIEATAPYLEVFRARLLVWSSKDEGFRV